ncbi:pleiotropic drug resistance 4 [Actinidia rufa]|uniref:Pleiotropic drug resistance 4 n=1 Tax=Actinidia rufa TaxID=165716 RepID=A0A7J0DHX8_9ERIC|nr:pleiotropic drug resistance 4 [Actinidia rufa]
MWNSSVNMFGTTRENKEDDDEEALRWASLQRSPTYVQARTSFFRNIAGEVSLVDIGELEDQEKNLVLDKLVNAVNEDTKMFFNRIKQRYNALTLLLGPPSSGKTTLLLALAGRPGPGLQMSGRITYNGHDLKEFVPQRTSAYVSQQDLHMAEMTVRETLEFSGRCQGVGFKRGLDVCADTLVGDEMLKGISGGQKKRLTTGELLVGSSRVLFMDEISNGLDSSTTHQIIKYLRYATHALDGATVISLLQPDPQTYELFDDIILLCEGQIVYQGPREAALKFFAHMGFRCPERKNVADFLQEVLSEKDQEQYWFRDRRYQYIPVAKFAEAFKSFWVGSDLSRDLAVPFDGRYNHYAALSTSTYGVTRTELLKISFLWQMLLMKRSSFVYIFKFVQSAIWVGATYYVVGFDPQITRCLQQFVVYFFLHQMSIALFRVMASLGRNMIVANTFGSFALLVVMALGGFILSRDSIPSWWIWGYWFSPLMYAQNAASVNEFLGHSWDKRAGNYTTLSLGEKLLKARSLFPESYWFWIGVGALLGYTILFNILFTLCLTYLNPLGRHQAVISKKKLQHKAKMKETEYAIIEMGEFLQHSHSYSGRDVKMQRGMVLPFQPLSMSFSNLSYYVDVPAEMKKHGEIEDKLQLLVNVTGAFRPGVLTALLLLMKRGGKCIYAGPLGTRSCKLIRYFEAIQGVPKIKPGYNPAAWILEVSSPAEEIRLGVDFADVYRKSSLFQKNKLHVEKLSKPCGDTNELSFPSRYSQSFFAQFLACLWKQNLSYWRNPQYTAVRFFYTVIISLMLGTICWRFGSKRNNQQDIFNAMGSMYAAVLFIGTTNVSAVQPVVYVERFVSYRERAAGMYSALPFAFAQVDLAALSVFLL